VRTSKWKTVSAVSFVREYSAVSSSLLALLCLRLSGIKHRPRPYILFQVNHIRTISPNMNTPANSNPTGLSAPSYLRQSMLTFTSHVWVKYLVALVVAFIPLIISNGEYELLRGTPYDKEMHSYTHVFVLGCIIASTYPLILDCLLDYVSYKELPFQHFRMISIFSVAICAIITLITQNTRYAASIGLTTYGLGFGIEIHLIVTFLSHLLPDHFTQNRVTAVNVFGFIWVMSYFLNVIPASHSAFIFYLFYVSFYCMFLVIIRSACEWLYTLYRNSVDHKSSLFAFIDQLSSKESTALNLVSACGILVIVFSVLFIFYNPNFANIGSLNSSQVIVLEVTRAFLGTLTCTLPQRLVRHDLITNAKLEAVMRSQFIKYISHEVRSPAAVVHTAINLVVDDLSKEVVDVVQVRSNCFDIRKSSKHLLTLLDDLLLYDRLEGNTVDLNIELTTPQYLFKTLIVKRQDSIQIQVKRAESCLENIYFNVDVTKLQVATGNILDMLLSRTKFEDGAILVRYDYKAPNRNAMSGKNQSSIQSASDFCQFTLTIEDSRSGFRIPDMSQLLADKAQFDRVGRGDTLVSGFSLWVARKLIHINNGEISIVEISDTSVQYIFEFVFPIVTSGNVHLSRDKPIASIQYPLGKSGKIYCSNKNFLAGIPEEKMSEKNTIDNVASIGRDFDAKLSISTITARSLKILVVDDSAMIRRIMVQLMKTLGHSAVEASDGFDAVAAVKACYEDETYIYDVILMDNQMPGMLGSIAASIIRADLNYSGLIIGVTGNAMEDDIQDFIKHGADEVVIKPLTVDKFNQLLEKHENKLERYC
jgi:CheY-like chemotaxis protein/signal transduction histidine kinase